MSSDHGLMLEFQAAKTALQDSVIARARTTEDGLRIATPEDLIILKLIANRPKDRIDLIGLCALPDLDWDYLREWAGQWEVEAPLDRTLADTPVVPIQDLESNRTPSDMAGMVVGSQDW